MYKRYFRFTFVGIRPFIVLSGLMALIAGFQHVFAQSQLAQDTYAIFEASCLNCHGPDGAFRETLLMEHAELIDGGTVIPGNPDASELYKRLLGPTENGVQMPLGQEPLPPQSVDTIRRWILTGAPDWAPTSDPGRRFVPPGEILESIETHLNSLSSFDRSYARYFTMTHLYNAGETTEVLGEYRKALNKLINSLSWGVTVINPIPIDARATIFYIDLRNYEWDVNDGWTKLEDAYPYHISFPEHHALGDQLGRLQTQMNTDVPSVHVDWFIATASTPPLYHELLSLPLTDRELESRLEVDVARNLVSAPGVRVWRAGFNNSGVSNHNRVVERHRSRYGAYWKSYDFAGSVGTRNIFTHPLGFTHDGGEAIFNLPNGLQAYYLADGNGFRLDAAPIAIVSNPAASDPTVRNGLSCIGCHTEGMKTFEDQVRSAIESNTNPPYDRAQALRLYVEQTEMDSLINSDMELYRGALEATGGSFGGVEPISRFHEAFHAPVDAAYAAAVVGLQTETFLERVRENTGLQNLGLLALDSDSGGVKRDVWTSSFRDIISALDYPDRVGEPPVITQPDVLPGGQVHIPDSNLRAAVAEALGKSANAPVTVEEMKRLRRFDAGLRNVKDLTGLQFATNLTWLHLTDNQISDLSPIAGLINLKALHMSDNNVSDLSPLLQLIDLEELTCEHNAISDLSPVAGLIKLKTFTFGANKTSDLSPIAALINLEHVRFSFNEVTDISVFKGLTNLRIFSTWSNPFSDLSPLAKLEKLEKVDICGAHLSQTSLAPLANLPDLRELYLRRNGISDVSSLPSLTGLNRLNLAENDISDISTMSAFTNLKWLDLHDNRISDLSPLAGLDNLWWIDLSDNRISDLSPLAKMTNLTLVYISGNENADLSVLDEIRASVISSAIQVHQAGENAGPKIEGPWLWVFLPTTRHKLNENVDLLARASGGNVTERQVATRGATKGRAVGDAVWTHDRLPPTGRDNLVDMVGHTLPDGVMYGSIILYSPVEQGSVLHLGSDQEVKVWLNGGGDTPAPTFRARRRFYRSVFRHAPAR